jgi:lysophospholipase L1-like esterase
MNHATTVVLALLLAMSAASPNIVIMGDTVGEYMGTAVASFCSSANVVNRAVAGSTAAEWGLPGGGSNESSSVCGFPGLLGRTEYRPCRADSAFSTGLTSLGSVSHVVLSVGANDYLSPPHPAAGCSYTRAAIASVVQEAIDNVIAAYPNPQGKILMFGYCQPTGIVSECSAQTAAQYRSGLANNLNGGIADACTGHTSGRCKYIESITACGGSATAFAPQCSYHSDVYHPNYRGYCKIVNRKAVQAALGCGAGGASADCNAVSPIVPGAPPLRSDQQGTCGTTPAAINTETPPLMPMPSPPPPPAAASKILIIGDSMGEYACDYLAQFCAGSTVINAAGAGTSAWDWGEGAGGGPTADTPTNAFRTAGRGVTHVWISLLGNDYFAPHLDPRAPGASSPKCQISRDAILKRIRPVVTDTRNAAVASGNGGVQMVFTAYCGAVSPECGTSDMSKLQGVYRTLAAENSDVTFVDVGTYCGGSSTRYADRQFFKDGIHLNKRGYCSWMTRGVVQSTFGCLAATYPPCASVPQLASCASQCRSPCTGPPAPPQPPPARAVASPPAPARAAASSKILIIGAAQHEPQTHTHIRMHMRVGR